jgi:hypothetical protein
MLHAARTLRLPLKNLRGMATSSLLAHLPAVPVTGKFPADAAGPVIGTHSGSFHCDEALACGMLHLLPEFRDAPVVRSRNPAEHERCAIVVDVGAVFDAGKLRFDHHQASFTDRYAPDAPTKLSSAGLVYRHYAPALIQAVATAAAGKPLEEPVLSKMVERTVSAPGRAGRLWWRFFTATVGSKQHFTPAPAPTRARPSAAAAVPALYPGD